MYRIFVILFLLSNIVYGETLKQVINIALKESPFLKQYQFQIKAVEGELKKAESFNNPNLNVSFGRIYSQVDGWSTALTDFEINQPLRLWGERKYATASTKLKKIAFEKLYKQQKRNLISNIYKQFFSILALKETIKTKEKEIKTLENLYQFVQKSYKLGESILLDTLRIEKDLAVAKVKLEQLKSQLQAAKNSLIALIGKNINSVEGDIYNFRDIKDINMSQVPQIEYLQYLIKSINEQIKRQKALAKPKVSVGVRIGEDAVELGKYEFGVGFNINLPVFYRRQGEIIQLINQKNILKTKINQLKLNYTATLNSLKSQEKILKKQFIKIDKNIIPTISKALSIAEKSFKLRTISFFEFSNVRQQYYDAIYYKIDLARQIQNIYASYIKIGGLR
jgi:outer membrane protein TolC